MGVSFKVEELGPTELGPAIQQQAAPTPRSRNATLALFEIPSHVKPPTDDSMTAAYQTVGSAFESAGFRPTITSGTRTMNPTPGKTHLFDDGLHGSGMAFDVATHRQLPNQLWEPLYPPGFIEKIVKKLELQGYDVVFSNHGTGPHLHVEADQRDPRVARSLANLRSRVRPLNARGGRRRQSDS